MAKEGKYRELTPLGVVSAVVVGAILNMAICYAGMQIGFTIVGSTVAAVLGFGLLRGILRKGSILEVNIFQTVASGVNTVNAGIIFTVPVLFLLGMQGDIDYVALVLAATAGSMLGVVMIIPLRKQIIDFERLRFPEGVATAMILKSPGAGVQKARLLVISIIASGTIVALTKIPDPQVVSMTVTVGDGTPQTVSIEGSSDDVSAADVVAELRELEGVEVDEIDGAILLRTQVSGTDARLKVGRGPDGADLASVLGLTVDRVSGRSGQPASLLGIVSGPFKVPIGDKTLIPEQFNVGEMLRIPAGFRLVFALSLLSLGAGYLAGRHGLVILYGTLLNYWVLIPICLALGGAQEWIPKMPADFGAFSFFSSEYGKADAFATTFSKFTSRAVGIGMILGGAIAGIMVALPALKAALASLRSSPQGVEREEISIKVLNGGLLGGLVALFFAAKLAGGDHVSWSTAFLVTLAGGLWLWLAGLVVAQTTGRTDWSPLSGLALIAIAIMMGIMGKGQEYVIPAVTVGAAICVATSMCADMMADLKTGYLVGSKPRLQQIAQIATCWIGPPIAILTVIMLWESYGFGPEQAQVLYDRAVADGQEALASLTARGGSPTSLPSGTPELGAPQSGALKAAIEIVQSGDVPLGKYLTGALLGLVVSLLVSPGMGVMIGLSMYLPFDYMIVFGLGGITNILVTKLRGARWAEDKGVPIAAGLIVGDALVGVGDAMYHVVKSLT